MAEPFRIAVLGAGSMGGAIVRGAAAALEAPALVVSNRSADKAASLADLPGVQSFSLEEHPDANTAAASAADAVVVGVKPAMVTDLLREIAPVLQPGTAVISVAAGVPIAAMEALLPAGTPVLRAMPNTAALVGQAVTGLSAGSAVTPEALRHARVLFGAVGTVVEVPEDQIDLLSTVSGSGPAYFYLVVEEFTRAAVERGFAEGQARALVEGTFLGAAALLAASDDDPAELRRRVTSPRGTTERAVAVLDQARLAAVFASAMDAALARARELAAGS